MKSKRILDALISLPAYTLALAVLPFFLLPQTLWASFSPLNEVPLFSYGGFTLGHGLMVFAGVFAVWFSYRRSAQRDGATTWVWWALLLYLTSFAVACFGLPLRVPLVANCTLVLVALGAGLLIARLCASAGRVAGVLSALGAAQAFYAFSYYMQGENILVSGTVVRASGTLGNPLFLATMMLVCLPLALGLALEEKRPFVMALWMIAVALMFASLLLTGTRGAMLALVPALTWMVWRLSGRWVVTVGFSVVVLALCFFVVARRSSGTVNQASAARSTLGHYNLMQRGWGVFRYNWLTGTGAGSLELPTAVQRAGVVSERVMMEPKNLALHWLAELGIGGGVLFVAFIVGISRIIQGHATRDALGIGGAWIALFVAGFFDTPFGIAGRPHGNALVGGLMGATLLLPLGRFTQTRKPRQDLDAQEPEGDSVETVLSNANPV